MPFVRVVKSWVALAALAGAVAVGQAPASAPEQRAPAPAAVTAPDAAQPVLPAEAPDHLPNPVAASPLLYAPPVQRPTPASVTLGDQTLFPITAALGPFSPADRAQALERKLQQFAKDQAAKPETITQADTENGTDILAGDLVLTRVTDQDSDFDAIGRSRQALAAAHVADMRAAIVKARDENSAKSLSMGALKASAATFVLVLLLILLSSIFPRIYGKINDRGGNRIRPLKIQSLEVLSQARITGLLLQTARLMRFTITLLLMYFFIPLVFSFFAATRHFGFELVSYVLAPIDAGWHAFINYLPRLLVVVVIMFFAHQAHKLARFLFREVERGTIVWSGFYPEWAMPTHRIVEILILAFAIVVAFPYLPGSNSAAFRGVSIFLGVLLSLGSSSVIANVVAGVLLTYTRAFRIGDRVQIAETTGDVIEKTLLATHVRTIKNVDITIPNGLVLGAHIINFSRSTTELPLILNTTLTIGYDIPWVKVHELMLAAANATAGLLKEPAPFVLQTSLDDFYVNYQINAYTAQPSQMALIYSDLNREMLDRFNRAGVEIMSPHYQVQRRTMATTVPEQYLKDEVVDEARHPHLGGN